MMRAEWSDLLRGIREPGTIYKFYGDILIYGEPTGKKCWVRIMANGEPPIDQAQELFNKAAFGIGANARDVYIMDMEVEDKWETLARSLEPLEEVVWEGI